MSNLFHLSMFALGGVTVFPWLCFITAVDYYSNLYGPTCMFYFAVANMVPLACTTIYLTFKKVTCSLTSRIRIPLLCVIIFLAAIPVINHLQSQKVISSDLGFSLTLVVIGIVAGLDSMMQNAVFGLVGSMVPNEGPSYIISLTTGGCRFLGCNTQNKTSYGYALVCRAEIRRTDCDSHSRGYKTERA
jgi:hypothetical protein